MGIFYHEVYYSIACVFPSMPFVSMPLQVFFFLVVSLLWLLPDNTTMLMMARKVQEQEEDHAAVQTVLASLLTRFMGTNKSP